VHLAIEGYPIIGDEFYGVTSPVITRQALHAHSISLTHPVTSLPLTVTAPLPADMAALATALNLALPESISSPAPA
jgi:hypothetical protein